MTVNASCLSRPSIPALFRRFSQADTEASFDLKTDKDHEQHLVFFRDSELSLKLT